MWIIWFLAPFVLLSGIAAPAPIKHLCHLGVLSTLQPEDWYRRTKAQSSSSTWTPCCNQRLCDGNMGCACAASMSALQLLSSTRSGIHVVRMSMIGC